MFSIKQFVGITDESSTISEPMWVGYHHKSNRKKGYAWMSFEVEMVSNRQVLFFRIVADKPSNQRGSKPAILTVQSPGKIISLTMIKTGRDSDGDWMYNLLVFYTKGAENNQFLTVFRISYDYKIYMQPSMYENRRYTCLRLISTIPIISQPVVHLAQQVELHSLYRKFPLHPIRNITFMLCHKRVLLRLKTYGQILPFLIRRLIFSCGIFSQNKRVKNKIELSIASRSLNMMLYMQILKLE